MADIVAPVAGQGEAVPPITTEAPPPVAASPVPWLQGADDLTVGYVQNKGWKEPAQVLDSYRNLEKLMGADKAGNTVVLPKEGATPQEMAAFYDRIGRPTEPSGYKLQVPEGMPAEFANAASSKMHELGIPQKAGEALGAWWNEQTKNGTAAQQEQMQQAALADQTALKEAWGAALPQNIEIAKTAARAFGLDEATINGLEKEIGFKRTMELFHKIGSKIGEPGFATGNNTEGFGNAMTPPQAKAKIAELTADKGFISKYVSKDAGAVAEMKRLHEYAYPEEQ